LFAADFLAALSCRINYAERLQKLIAQAGIASRRAAEELIKAGEVSSNGEIVTELGTKADPETGSHQSRENY
jgi:16S rRNA U516 pseudouridylate synthase RsuA-like enzyme